VRQFYQKALGRVPGVQNVQVDVAAKTVRVTHNAEQASPAAIAHALDDAGFPTTPAAGAGAGV
jgi:copper chaperone CopZ